jgi:hypothetical protein
MRLVSPISFVLLVGSLSACADKGDEGMFILSNTAPPVGATCTLTGDPMQPFTAAGEISHRAALVGAGYVLTPLIESRITANVGSEAQRTIHLEGANVTVAVANGAASPGYTALFAGSIAPNGGSTNVAFEVLSASQISTFGSATQNVEVVANVAVYGTLGGGRIDAEPFQYPITIIGDNNGITFGTTTLCSSMPPTARKGNPCNPYQDGTVDCCQPSAGGNPVCPAVAETP